MKYITFMLLICIVIILSWCESSEDKDSNNWFTGSEIIYTTWTRIYDEIWLSNDNQDEIELFNKLQSEWKNCKEQEYWIWWWYNGCESITWYTHIYTLPQLWLIIDVYKNSMPDTINNPWIFQHNIAQPFTLSWNIIIETRNYGVFKETYSIEYHDIHSIDSIESILKKEQENLWDYNTELNVIKTGEVYDIAYNSKNEYVIKTFLFQPWKSYYYIYTQPWSSCNPWPCGLNQHDIKYFMK